MSTFHERAVDYLKSKSMSMISRVAGSKKIDSRTVKMITLIMMGRISIIDLPSDDKSVALKAITKIYNELKCRESISGKILEGGKRMRARVVYGGGDFFDGRCRVPANRLSAIVANY